VPCIRLPSYKEKETIVIKISEMARRKKKSKAVVVVHDRQAELKTKDSDQRVYGRAHG